MPGLASSFCESRNGVWEERQNDEGKQERTRWARPIHHPPNPTRPSPPWPRRRALWRSARRGARTIRPCSSLSRPPRPTARAISSNGTCTPPLPAPPRLALSCADPSSSTLAARSQRSRSRCGTQRCSLVRWSSPRTTRRSRRRSNSTRSTASRSSTPMSTCTAGCAFRLSIRRAPPTRMARGAHGSRASPSGTCCARCKSSSTSPNHARPVATRKSTRSAAAESKHAEHLPTPTPLACALARASPPWHAAAGAAAATTAAPIH